MDGGSSGPPDPLLHVFPLPSFPSPPSPGTSCSAPLCCLIVRLQDASFFPDRGRDPGHREPCSPACLTQWLRETVSLPARAGTGLGRGWIPAPTVPHSCAQAGRAEWPFFHICPTVASSSLPHALPFYLSETRLCACARCGGACPAALPFPQGRITPPTLKTKILRHAQAGNTGQSQAPLQNALEYVFNSIMRLRSRFIRK